MQAGVTSQLVRFVGHPLLAATVSFVVGTAALALCSFGVGTWPTLAALLDHYGLVGFAVRPLSLWRVVGAAFVVAGVVLIRRC
jgi:bacterial/archaeal transporter family-2 protein